jgi:hypothetical protein
VQLQGRTRKRNCLANKCDQLYQKICHWKRWLRKSLALRNEGIKERICHEGDGESKSHNKEIRVFSYVRT